MTEEARDGRRRPADRSPAAIVVLTVAALVLAASDVSAAVTAEQLQQKIEGLSAAIRRTQRTDGSFGGGGSWPVGQTALGVLGLRAAGAEPDDPAVRKAAEYLANEVGERSRQVYETALKVMALQAVDVQEYRPQIAAGAAYLVDAQQDSGGWTYARSGRTDNSNSQFAVLGLHSAALAGVNVPEAVWESARTYFLRRQGRDGGWSYTSARNNSYGSMTAAGVASLYICDLWLHVRDGRCGVYPDQAPLERGLDWLARNFSVTQNPGHRLWKFYYLYGLERAGVILARRYFGNRDWYREGVEHLVGDREAAVMGGSPNESTFLKQCFMLLFLAKGNAPIILHKAEWAGRWNRNRYDARFLASYVGQELGRPLDWQVVPLDAPLDRLMAAPILYVSGSGPARWSPQQIERLQQYVQAGGVLLAEAADGDRQFDDAFRELIGRAFPREPLEEVAADHPLYDAYFHLPADQRPRLESVKGPCWISVLYAPEGLSCPWDVAQFEHPHFQLGVNIIAYVTGLQRLEGKLVERDYALPPETEPGQRGGSFVVGQVVHAGQWRPHQVAWPKILERVNRKAGISVYNVTVPVDLQTTSPFEAHALYLTGVDEVRLSEEVLEGLRVYLRRGGFLFAEAACGSRRFDRSFRELVRELFPDRPLERMAVGHPLLETGERLGEVRYTDPVLREEPGLERPFLEFVEVEGRAVIVYTKYDLSSVVDGHPCYHCPAVLEPSASRLLTKTLLYGLSR